MSVYAIYFSPTRNTEKIVKILAKEFGNYGEIDLSKQSSGENVRAFKEEDICIFGVPSYGAYEENERESGYSYLGCSIWKPSI